MYCKYWMIGLSLVLLWKSYSLSLQAAQTDHPHSAISNIGKSIFGSLQKALLVQRIEPLSSTIVCLLCRKLVRWYKFYPFYFHTWTGAAVAVILKTLLNLQVQCGQTTDLKLIYQSMSQLVHRLITSWYVLCIFQISHLLLTIVTPQLLMLLQGKVLLIQRRLYKWLGIHAIT